MWTWRATKLRDTDLWIGNKLFHIDGDGKIEPQPSAEFMAAIVPHPSFTKTGDAPPKPPKKVVKPKAKPKAKAKAKPVKKSKPKAAKKEE